MEVAVVGGTGSVGAPIADELVRRGDSVRILSRTPRETPLGTSHHRVDVKTGAGLAEALAGVEAVVDAVNDTRAPKDALVDGTHRLTAAEAEAGVRHHLAISIVGCDRIPFGYYRAKVEQERAVEGAPVGWSLLRATQFHTLLVAAFAVAERLRVVPTGSARLQPIAPEIVAKRIADAVHDGPGGRLPDIAGPEPLTLSELAAAWRRHRERRLVRVRLPMVGPIGRPLRAGALCDPAAAAGGATFEQWLARRAAAS